MKTVVYKTVKHYFSELNKWFSLIDDPRNENHNMYEYPPQAIIWEGILMFLSKIGSRRQINFELKNDKALKNLNVLAKTDINTIPHDCTLGYLMEILNIVELAKIRTKMISCLIRNKVLFKYRLYGYYLIVIDGSECYSSDKPHCKNCLTEKKDSVIIRYYHKVLESKIVTPTGLVLSIETEFIENSYSENESDTDCDLEEFHMKHRNKLETKQDCEIKAFHRLIERLKQRFPQLKICLGLDALFANQYVLDKCERYNWKYFINFKEGSMPATFAEYKILKEINPDCSRNYKVSDTIKQEYRWVNDIDFECYKLNALECKEMEESKEDKTFVWMTNFELNHNNYNILGNKGGRLRWKIENEGFNMQKNGGYNMEHLYSEDPNGMKNFYLLMQIAHIINLLIEKGNLIAKDIKKTFGSIRNIARRLLESLRNTVFNLAELSAIDSAKFQIRLRSP